VSRCASAFHPAPREGRQALHHRPPPRRPRRFAEYIQKAELTRGRVLDAPRDDLFDLDTIYLSNRSAKGTTGLPVSTGPAISLSCCSS
jgi:hypothetical protein